MPKTYKDLDVWRVSMTLVAEAYRVTMKMPAAERYGLTAQTRRAAVSIPCNIAEGYGRATRGEYLNQISVARGSLNELETLCLLCRELGLIQVADLREFDDLLGRVRHMLARLRQGLMKRPR